MCNELGCKDCSSECESSNTNCGYCETLEEIDAKLVEVEKELKKLKEE